jgi:putative transposase
MAMKRFRAEQIVTLLRQIEVELTNGKTTPQACKEAEITIQTYYRWRPSMGLLTDWPFGRSPFLRLPV